jgi:hypothetical protein
MDWRGAFDTASFNDSFAEFGSFFQRVQESLSDVFVEVNEIELYGPAFTGKTARADSVSLKSLPLIANLTSAFAV